MNGNRWRGGLARPPAPRDWVNSDDDAPSTKPNRSEFQPSWVENWITARYALTGAWPPVIPPAAGIGGGS